MVRRFAGAVVGIGRLRIGIGHREPVLHVIGERGDAGEGIGAGRDVARRIVVTAWSSGSVDRSW